MTGKHVVENQRRRSSEDEVVAELSLVFLPLHKLAFGLAVGTASGIFVFAMTMFHLIVDPPAPNLNLLGEYFYGYTVSWPGAFVGLFWGFVAGFASGWFLAFSRNLVIAASIFLTRTRAEMAATRDFLDHI